MLLTDTVREWRDRFIASFEGDHPEEAAFWRDELADACAAMFWYRNDTSAKATTSTP
jgi:hypothetical protein